MSTFDQHRWIPPQTGAQVPGEAAGGETAGAMVGRREKEQNATARRTAPGQQSTATGWVMHRDPWAMGGLAMVVVLALVAGLLFFMTRAPEAPTGVRAADSTATSVLVGWNPSTGGRSVDKYLILRDGTQVGSVSGSSSTYLDKGLSPGGEHRYGVVASSGSRRSDPSVALVTSTIAPSPVRLTAGSSTITTLAFRWSPPPDSPKPDQYVILRDGDEIGAVPGTATSYRDSGLVPVTTFRYQVAAEWADAQSEPTTELVMKTGTPTLASARLAGSWPVDVKAVRAPGGGSVKAGTTWTTTWQFAPKCKTGPCAVVVAGDPMGSGFTSHSFKATLTRHGATYTGTTKAHITHCSNTPTTNTITLTIRLKGAAMDGTSWAADSWAGTMVMASPYKSVGRYYCPAQSVSTTISGSN